MTTDYKTQQDLPDRRKEKTYPTGNKTLSTQLYSARLTRQEKRKDSNDMQGNLACWFIASIGSITKRASLYSIFINSRIGSLTNHSM